MIVWDTNFKKLREHELQGEELRSVQVDEDGRLLIGAESRCVALSAFPRSAVERHDTASHCPCFFVLFFPQLHLLHHVRQQGAHAHGSTR